MPIGIGTGIAVAAGVGAVGAVAGGAIQGNAAKSAANTSANAANNSLQEQQNEFQQTQATQQQNYADSVAREQTAQGTSTAAAKGALDANTALNNPYITTGTDSLNRLASLYGLSTVDANGNVVQGSGSGNIDPNATFYQTPDYQFSLSQGIKGVDAGAAARGMLDSGATRKAEIAYAGNLASGQFDNYASRLASLAGVGQSAAGNQQTANTNYASQVGNAAMSAAGGSNSAGANMANQITGAGTNYANAVTNINTGNANTQANAQLSGANSTVTALNALTGQAQQAITGRSPFASSYSGGTGAGAAGTAESNNYFVG